MNETERAADVIFDHIRERGPSVDTRHLARDLADAGLLVTDADRAVLDAAEEVERMESEPSCGIPTPLYRLVAAVRARREGGQT